MKEIGRRDFIKMLGGAAGTLAVAAAVPAWAGEILPGGLIVANALPIEDKQLQYNGQGIVTQFDMQMRDGYGEITTPTHHEKRYVPGLMEWQLTIQGVGGLGREPHSHHGFTLDLADGQRWLVKL